MQRENTNQQTFEGAAQSQNQSIPKDVLKWNWGAFLLTWIWGIGNGVWKSLLVFIPLFGFIWMFVLGAKGSQWAWQTGRWQTVDEFKQSQRKWAIGALCVWAAFALMFLLIFAGVFSGLKNSVVSTTSFAIVSNSSEIQDELGTPITRDSLTTGSITKKMGSGYGNIQYSVKGPKGEAKVYAEGVIVDDQWDIIHLNVVTPTKEVLLINKEHQSESIDENDY